MNRSLYFECYSGISGDMAVASLLDLGADRKILLDGLSTLNMDGFRVEIKNVIKNSVFATDFNVIIDDGSNAYDHDIEYLYGNKQISHQSNHHSRNLKTILDIINSSGISEKAKQIASRIFKIIANAEAKAHNKTVDEVHFHEVGAVDSIVDVVSFAICFDNLGVEKVYCSELCDGSGTVRCQHGILSVPVPAVTNIVSEHSLPLKITDFQGELVTPTGAAIIAAVRNEDNLPEKFTIKNIGIGAGKRENHLAGVLKAMIIE